MFKVFEILMHSTAWSLGDDSQIALGCDDQFVVDDAGPEMAKAAIGKQLESARKSGRERESAFSASARKLMHLRSRATTAVVDADEGHL